MAAASPAPRRRTQSGEYRHDTIGPAQGASLLRSNPTLSRSQGSSAPPPQHERRMSAQEPFNNLEQRFPQQPYPDHDPFHEPQYHGSSMESTDLSALGDEVKTYQDGSSNGFPLPPQNRPTQQSIAQHGLSERADAAEELQDSMDEAELRAQQYARMSPAEQYALQARMHTEQQQGRQSQDLRMKAMNLAAGRRGPSQSQEQVAPAAYSREVLYDSNDDQLGSPFKQQQNGQNLPQYPQQQYPQQQYQPPKDVKSPATSRTERPPVSGSVKSARPRKVSGSSTHSASSGGWSKDDLLERMAEALRRERAKNKAYMKELVEAENEIDAMSRLLDNLRSEHSQTNSKNLHIISALKRELERSRQNLIAAHDVGPDDAERFLDLLDNQHGSGKTVNSRFREEENADDDVPRSVGGTIEEPMSKNEAALALAQSQPGGVSAAATKRVNERRRRLDNALSTIASSRLDNQQSRGDIPFPQENIIDSEDEDDQSQLGQSEVSMNRMPVSSSAGTSITVEPPASNGPFSFFRRRSNSASMSKASRPPNRLRRNSSGRNTSSAENVTTARLITAPVEVASPMSADRVGGVINTKPRSGSTASQRLMPPTLKLAQGEGTYGRSASSDVPRGPVTSPLKERKRKTSISKILAMAFPVRDERKVEDYNWDRYDTTAA